MADVASQTVGEVVRRLMGYIIKQVGYLTSSAKHVRHMENRMKLLEGTNSDVKSRRDANNINNKEIPTRVPGWLQDVEKINKDVKSISSTARTGCFNIKGRYQAATKALEASMTIERLIKENSDEIIWTDKQKPLGRVYSELGSKSTPSQGDTESGSKSRDQTFNVALKHLQQDDKTRVIALCGMGGVGKTTMMKHLKTVAWDNKMFNYIVTVIVGGNFDLKSIQHALAVQTGDDISESDEKLRADYLFKRFEKLAEGKNKCLVILDDVWNKIDLSDIGLNPLPNGFKLLLTSRDASICRQIAHDVEVVQVEVLEETEARDLFFQITGVSEHNDYELYEIGSKIVKKCGGLPLAIKVIAATLKSPRIHIWELMFRRMENNKPGEEVRKCMEISYTNLTKEEKEIFQLCGMFPEDSDIPIEDLTRYAWGLKLLEDVSTMEDSRNMTKTCVQNLIDSNLLMVGDSDDNDYVKMHDIVLAFVVDIVSNCEDAWIIKHGDMSNWNNVKMSKTCKQISLACKGGSEFPQDFKFPNLNVLKLMQGKNSLLFPEDFYGEMGNLKVIAYDNMKYPLLPTFRCSINLQTLCLHNCSLTFDLTCIGDLSSLEVLSFANSHIKKLPTTFKNLKKLRVLDLTGCDGRLVIDDGVLESLDTLEELYMSVVAYRIMGIDFTYKNCNELAELSKKLSALDIEIFKNKAQPRYMSFQNLKRFRISVGCLLKRDMHPYENTLMLVTNKGEILDSRLNELFKKTKVLLLTVDGMNNLADLEIKSLARYSSFNNLRNLAIENCGELGHVFTLNIATSLSKLEILEISSCAIIEEIIHIENNETHTITFPKLKSLTLDDLPMLSCLCNTVSAINLPELIDLKLTQLPNFTSIYPNKKLATSLTAMRTLLTQQVAIPKLERLFIYDMENLKEIWPCESSSSERVMLRDIKVEKCKSLVNLFPYNPMSLLPHLEGIEVNTCSSVEVLFNIDMDRDWYRDREIVECNRRLRSIKVHELRQLREIWRVKGGNNSHIIISSFQAVETIKVQMCGRFRNLFTPTTSYFDMRALTNLQIRFCGESRKDNLYNQEEEINVISNEEIREVHYSYFNVSFPPNLIHNINHLYLRKFDPVEVIFEINSSSSRELETVHQQPLQLFPYLKDLNLRDMQRMSHVWKCSDWNDFFQKQQPLVSLFHNLTTIHVSQCHNIKYLFSPLMAKLFSNLKKVTIDTCESIQEVVSNRDDDGEMSNLSSSDTIATFFPHFHSLSLRWLQNLKDIGGGSAKDESKLSEVGVVSWYLSEYIREIEIASCDALSVVIPSYAIGQMQKLEKLEISNCKSVTEIFESEGIVNINSYVDEPLLENMNVLQRLSHLREIEISNCELLEYVFTFSTLESLRQLQKLKIEECKAMKEIVKQEINQERRTSDVVVFPCLKSVQLIDLPNLLGFFLGENDFDWKSLEEVVIRKCPQVKVFTSGHSTSPNLNFIYSSLGKHHIPECGLNFQMASASQGTPWSYQNLIEVKLVWDSYVKKIIPSNELLQVKKLERIQVVSFSKVEEIFEVALEGTNTRVQIPNLAELALRVLPELKYIWKNNQRMVLELPNLTTLEIRECDSLKHVFTSSMVGSLLQLQDLKIIFSDNIEVIFKEEEEECYGKVKPIELPRLKSLRLYGLKSLKGFCLGNAAFSFPSLDTLEINICQELTVFTDGHSTTPKLRRIEMDGDMHDLEGDLSTFINTKLQEGFKL